MHRSDRLFWLVTGLVLLAALSAACLIARVGPPRSAAGGSRAGAGLEPRTNKSVARPRPSAFSPGARTRRRLMFSVVQGDDGFERLGEPAPGDWLWSFRESGQTLEEYALEVSNRKGRGRHTLHLLPFDDLDPRQARLVPRVREHTALYFDTRVELLPRVGLPRRWYARARGQYDAGAIVGHLARRVPADSLGLFGLMGSDLYGLGLNYVFGMALLHERAGIYSVRRYGRDNPMLLRRALKLSAHEIGHMFGLKHCVFYKCVMNGVNSLAEMDRSPLHLCPVCLAKLQWNLKFSPARRYRRLAALYREWGLEPEARFAAARAAEVEQR